MLVVVGYGYRVVPDYVKTIISFCALMTSPALQTIAEIVPFFSQASPEASYPSNRRRGSIPWLNPDSLPPEVGVAKCPKTRVTSG